LIWPPLTALSAAGAAAKGLSPFGTSREHPLSSRAALCYFQTLKETSMRLHSILVGSALLTIGAAFAYLFLILDRDASSPALAQAPAVVAGKPEAASMTEPGEAATTTGKPSAAALRVDVKATVAALRRDRDTCYASLDPGKNPDEPACDRIGFHERTLSLAGAEIPRSYPYDPPPPNGPDGGDAVARYLRLRADKSEPAEKIEAVIHLLIVALHSDRRQCYDPELGFDDVCAAIGHHERGLIHYGIGVPEYIK